MRSRLLVLFILLSLARASFGQLNNRVFEDRMSVEAADSGKLFAGLNTLGFFKNNEYTKTIVEGYTLFGYQFQPFISYHLTKSVRIDAGGYFQKDFGSNDFSTAAPVFSIKWSKGKYAVIFGNIESSLNHRLIEPLYDFERVLTDRLETGVQLQHNSDDFFVDAWIDWQYMQYWRDLEQEQFVGGLSAVKKIVQIGRGSLSVPVQLLFRHQGGQLDVAGLPIQTLVNSAVGLNWTQPVGGLVSQFVINGYYVYGKDVTQARQAYNDGDAIYLNGTVSTRWGLDVMVSYWQAREFQSFMGGKVYQSVSYFDPATVQPSPQLLMARFLYDRKVTDNLYLTLRYEPFYDLAFTSFQYSYGLYLTYRDRYYLLSRKK